MVGVGVQGQAATGRVRPPYRRLWPVLRHPVVPAVAAGGGLLLSFPPYDLWWLAPVAVATLAVAVHRLRPAAAAGLGLLAGLVLFLPVLSWTNLHTGYLPWVLLSVAEAGYLAAMAAAAAYASPLVDRRPWLWPLLTGLLWVAQEALRDRTPFGGFPWARLAFSQGDSPLLRLAAVGGAPLVTFGVAVTGGALGAAGWRLAVRYRGWREAASGGSESGGSDQPGSGGVGSSAAAPAGSNQPGSSAADPAEVAAGDLAGVAAGGARPARPAGPATARVAGRPPVPAPVAVLAAVALAVPVGSLAVPSARPAGPPVTVAIVQGNVPRMGLDFNAQRRAVLDNHVRATLELADRVAAGVAARPDLVVWPENASDIDPLRHSDAAAAITRAARAVGVPILLGAVLRGSEPGTVRNAGLLWRPDGGPDLDQLYVKRHPVPFAEYVPLRRIARMVSTEVDRVSSDFQPGSTPGVLSVGPARIGDVICFEVAYDEVVRDTVTGGAQLLVVQTNNATFNVAEARQQLAMVRLRAVEHGRNALMASTVGVSGFVTADGAVVDATGFNEQAVVVRELRLSATRTLATTLGYWPEAALVALAVAMLAAAVPARRRARVPSTAQKGGQQR